MSYTEILISIFAFLGGITSTFVISYFKEKGKNLATKEDIKQITSDVEQIKNEINFEKLRENDYLQERKNKLILFIPSGITHKNLIVKILYAFDRVDDILYIRDLYNCIYEERLRAETIFYECLAFNQDERIVESLNKFINQIGDTSAVLIRTIHGLEGLASKRNLILKDEKITNRSTDLLQEINDKLKSNFSTYEEERKELEKKIAKGILDYSIFINVLYGVNYHQKINF